MPYPWKAWLLLLGVVNMAGGVWYFRQPAGQTALAAIMLAFLVMAIIYSRYGFVRLLGLGHIIAWTPLVGFFSILLYRGAEDGLYRWWLLSVIIVNVASLVIDVIDVGRYIRGERQPTT